MAITVTCDWVLVPSKGGFLRRAQLAIDYPNQLNMTAYDHPSDPTKASCRVDGPQDKIDEILADVRYADATAFILPENNTTLGGGQFLVFPNSDMASLSGTVGARTAHNLEPWVQVDYPVVREDRGVVEWYAADNAHLARALLADGRAVLVSSSVETELFDE